MSWFLCNLAYPLQKLFHHNFPLGHNYVNALENNRNKSKKYYLIYPNQQKYRHFSRESVSLVLLIDNIGLRQVCEHQKLLQYQSMFHKCRKQYILLPIIEKNNRWKSYWRWSGNKCATARVSMSGYKTLNGQQVIARIESAPPFLPSRKLPYPFFPRWKMLLTGKIKQYEDSEE